MNNNNIPFRTRPIVVTGKQARKIAKEMRQPSTQEKTDRLRQILSNRVPRIDKQRGNAK
ncbi:hypothetical protein [Alicyclobacillus acidoterrestris]|uniref:Uncharacterized protein n=1 Tax=Alicyclobacillus acidoterrestris (strain ATCC 49025 / DSM 3922 / CIP 106132 / NCIMB 13137 / GD3B) TaxID=1356854 RepID=T0C3X3_ALIAG|nr:hypothetical protein [Alicyclobacillus acidoterrestris]EPZ47704.1 hypothetical protein N007_05470 [Alicyclobacillus acidoterrestris ATCC 49025]UNO47981.1 hypothetical protein K1I37_15005 [Alicyclobacillus acidoterrestris]